METDGIIEDYKVPKGVSLGRGALVSDLLGQDGDEEGIEFVSADSDTPADREEEHERRSV